MFWWILGALGAVIVLVVIYDVLQRTHTILHNFPIVGHFRYWLEAIGPELRQYIVTSNDEERPFSRDRRRWVYSSSKHENNYFGFGTDNDIERATNYLIIEHAVFPVAAPSAGEPGYDPDHGVPCAKVLGGHRGRPLAFRPSSIVNISAMSFGSLSATAIEALNRGAHLANALHNTGEGGVSPYHKRGGDLIWQLGTGYFGCRDERGRFHLDRLIETCSENPVRAIEIKLSQGAKPGKGGLLPAAKITSEISAIRGIPMGQDCKSPAHHTAFHDVDSMLDFVETLAEATGLPVGIKSAVGEMTFWRELAERMGREDRGVDFITIDGGEGGTGAAPLTFSDHVALPFRVGFTRVYKELHRAGVADRVVLIGSGKLGFPEETLLTMALGCDMINVAREAMLAIGCIQAQRCHTGHCPAGIATQSPWLMRGLDPTLKAARLANYLIALRKEVMELAQACGVEHPALVGLDHFELVSNGFETKSAAEAFGYEPGWGAIAPAIADELRAFLGQQREAA
ncbi:FMN-binding glutamate synthase family protein [Haliangium sp.]|uniref:FMN-binding glutamate synthase family protein n=1 Tax=Haliangium sp. TaxID=2663208 RepID=UPI003D0C2B6C